MRRVLFYDDSPLFGGHQVTAAVAAEFLSRSRPTAFAFNRDNRRLRSRLEGSAVEIIETDTPRVRAQPFLSPLGIDARPALNALRASDADVVVAVQGSILQSNRVVEAARRARVLVIGFIPMPLTFAPSDYKRRIVGALIAPYHYRRPDGFITTSQSARAAILRQGARPPVEVAYYGPDLSAIGEVDRASARRRLGMTDSDFVVATIGRVSILQKGHDVLLDAIAILRQAGTDVRLLIAGEGEDDDAVASLIADKGLGASVIRTPWLDNPADAYAAADIVAIPSRFEGLPLVALEAMYHRRCVVAANVGALAEIVPPEWLVEPENPRALADRILELRTRDCRSILAKLRSRIETEFNSEAFGMSFTRALETIAAARAKR